VQELAPPIGTGPKQRDTKAEELTMANFKKMMMIGAAALTLSAGVAATAQAQPLNTAYLDRLDWRVTRAAQDGRIPWGEARDMRQELRSVRDLAWRAETGRLNDWQYRRLTSVVHDVEMRTEAGYRYGYGYGRSWNDGWRR
jgi:hypothetical protein